jgi:hypothetical protein
MLFSTILYLFYQRLPPFLLHNSIQQFYRPFLQFFMPKRLNFYTSLLIKHSLNWTEMREEKCLVVNSRSTEARLTGLRGGGGRLYRQQWVAHFTTVFLTAHASTRQNVFQCGFGDLNSNWAPKQSGRHIILNKYLNFLAVKVKTLFGQHYYTNTY